VFWNSCECIIIYLWGNVTNWYILMWNWNSFWEYHWYITGFMLGHALTATSVKWNEFNYFYVFPTLFMVALTDFQDHAWSCYLQASQDSFLTICVWSTFILFLSISKFASPRVGNSCKSSQNGRREPTI
jgi:hypothetical protein